MGVSARPGSSAASLLAAVCLLMMTLATPAQATDGNGRARAAAVTAHAARIGATAGARFARSAGRAAARELGPDKTGPGSVTPIGDTGDTGDTAGASGSQTAAAIAQHDVRFGAFTSDAPYGGNVDAVDALQAALGRHVDIVNWYQSFGGGDWVSQVQPGVIGAVTGSGRTPLLTWEPWVPGKGAEQPGYRLARLADGTFDAYLGAWADGLKATGSTIYLRPMHEFNGNWYPWGGTVNGNTPAGYVAAWRHMHDVFVAHGATNVKWVWSPANVSVPVTAANAIERYYPGTAYVDVMAIDGYNWGADRPDYGGWQTFSQVFEHAYDTLVKLGPQPIWLAEVGCSPTGGDKTAWVRDMWATAKTWSRLQAVVWFDQDKEEDWRAVPAASAFAREPRASPGPE